VFTLIKDYKQVLHIAVYEHRNVDSLVTKSFKGFFFNTPRAEDLQMKDKWDYDKSFDYGNVIECGKYVVDTFERETQSINNTIENAKRDYYELDNIVTEYKGTFDELFDELKGYNKYYPTFDVNFKSITTSVYCDDNGNLKLGYYFDVWNNDTKELQYEHITIDSLNMFD